MLTRHRYHVTPTALYYWLINLVEMEPTVFLTEINENHHFTVIIICIKKKCLLIPGGKLPPYCIPPFSNFNSSDSEAVFSPSSVSSRVRRQTSLSL